MKTPILIPLTLLMAQLTLAAPTLPEPSGPYPVGMRRFELADLPGYVWYPAKKGTHGTRPYFTNEEVETQGRAMARNFDYGADELDGLDQVRAHSVENAVPVSGGKFPVLLFNHGYECYPAQNTALVEELASHGYVVISIAHPAQPGGRDPQFAAIRKQLASTLAYAERERALDGYAAALARDRLGASFSAWREQILSTVSAVRERHVPKSLLPVLATADTQRFGFIGMSFGGAMAASTCRLVEQCRVAVNFDGGNYDPSLYDAPVERPLLLLMRSRDSQFNPNDYAYERWSQAGLNPDVVRLRLEGIQHMGFTDLILLLQGPAHDERFGTIDPQLAVQTISAATRAFLDQYLKSGSRKTLDAIVARTPQIHVHIPARDVTGG